jgi:DNA-binding MarR family transcriptional regulator
MSRNRDLPPSLIESADRINQLLRCLQKSLRDKLFEESRRYGFTAPQLGVIFSLYKKPYITLNELCELIYLSKSTVSGIVDRLVAQNVVIREIPEDNRRIVQLSLTPEFVKDNDLLTLKERYIVDTLHEAAPEELEQIIAGLEKLYALVKKNGEVAE